MIFVGQALILTLELGEDITGCTCLMKYQTPTGIKGNVSAVITDAENGIIQATMVFENTLAIAGNWTFWGYATFSDGRSVPGEATKIPVYEEGQVARSSTIYN